MMGGWITAPMLGVEMVESMSELEFPVTMEDRSEWLRSAFSRVYRLEKESFA